MLWIGLYISTMGFNLGTVVPDKIYRSAAPNKKEFKYLGEALHINTVIDLRNPDLMSDSEAEEQADYMANLNAAGIKGYRSIPMSDKHPPTPAQEDEFLRIVEDPSNWPVLVHCQGGRHRTGAMVALYRVRHDGWTAAQAFTEAKAFGYYDGPFGRHAEIGKWIIALK